MDGTDPQLTSEREWAAADGVVLSKDGRLRAKMATHSNSGTAVWLEKKEELGEKRKHLYYGLEGYDEHSLEEANRIVEDEWNEFVEEQRSLVGQIVKNLRETFH